MTTADRDHFVYRLYDADGQLLYVGCTKRLKQRWAEHRTSKRRMVAKVARCKLFGPLPRKEARLIERVAIRAESPLYGWTPEKHQEKCRRDRWIDKQMQALIDDGVDLTSAIDQACGAADEWFPDPYAHEFEGAVPA